MNERIKELHDKAFDGIDILEPNWFLKHNKKFAELIVRECVTKMALEIMNNSWIDDAVKNTYEHFGVE